MTERHSGHTGRPALRSAPMTSRACTLFWSMSLNVHKLKLNSGATVTTSKNSSKLDGFQATRIIRKLPKNEQLPLVALTAYAFDDDSRYSLTRKGTCHEHRLHLLPTPPPGCRVQLPTGRRTGARWRDNVGVR
ncbi:hypothetical protein ACCAA_350104 [Candidatus Accumulibacter aalborgensis]|uniref:Uncharacterized protein n=1 Tax=Candidatus Accumulibacter aalborgensis TaxID=1860102 RepID=A0A1A8XNH3_9PROT|nr:hypothetical protein ACCAA_350104 [Candidatus Accumulibacter aalborgensis]